MKSNLILKEKASHDMGFIIIFVFVSDVRLGVGWKTFIIQLVIS